MAGNSEFYTTAAAVTPSDSTVLNCTAFYVGGAGNVAITPRNSGTAVTLTAVIPGTVYNIACNKIMATGTTATLLVALW